MMQINYEELMRKLETQEWLTEHYKLMFGHGCGELHYEKVQQDNLLNIINEIEVLTDDEVIKKIISIGKERYELDKIIHAKQVFK